MATTDENDLLRQVEIIQSNADAVAIDAAIRALEPLVRETARRVCRYRGVSQQLAHDFIEEAIAAMTAPRQLRDGGVKARIADYRPSDGPFTGWLWTSLYYLLIDVTRKEKRRSKLESTHKLADDFEHSRGSAGSYVADGDENEPFGDRDLRLIESWRPRDRLRLLAATELSRKVPRRLWESWCDECDVALPFPPLPNDFEQWNEWLAVLADAMQESRAAFRQHWYRKREHLGELDYVRELRDEG
ncbi:MAG TPA: hypothetical protein VNH11_07385 [Pirellulales bacterium]|nr:hypothetical protein [Pirellulales bacterium]